VHLSNARLPDGTLAAFILDITERKRFETELIDSRQRYRALFEEAQRQTQALTLRDLMHQALAGGLALPEILRVLVEGIARTLGYTLVSLYLLDGDVLKLQHQVGYHQVIASIAPGQGVSGRVVRTQQTVFLPDVRLDPDFLGAIEGVTSEICVPLFEQGQVAGVLNVESRQGTALTEADLRLMLALGDLVNFALSQARLSAQVRESQQRFAGAFNYATIGMALVAPDGRWLQVNSALCRIVGYSAEELLATNFQAITHPDDLNADLGYMTRVLAGDINTYQMEKRYLHKRGHVVWILLSVSLVRDAAGQPLYFISQINDITERKQAEQALAEQAKVLATERDLMQALMDNIPDTIYFKDTASRFTRINRAQAQFLGVPGPEAALGRTDLDFQEPGLAREIFDEEQRLMATGQPVINRVDQVPTADGQPRWLTSTKVPLWEGGRVVGLVGVSRDITAMKQAEARLLASLQEKEVLLKEIHHRVKNNLQVVSSLLHLQAETINDPRLRDAFDDSQRRVRSMALIHEQLYRSPDLAHIDFAEYVNGLLVYLRRSQVRTGAFVQLKVEIDQVTLELDRAIPLGLMVNELVTNSLKYAFPPGAPPAPEARIWVSAAHAADGALAVEVGDTGVGLPEALDLDHPASMGLQLVQSFVQQLRGQLRVQRRPGTVFRVTIPERKKTHG
jgi:PAS domain S-box-containing protein